MLDHHHFWSKVQPEPNSGCWIWIGARCQGYGRIDGKKWGENLVHRLSYQIAHGDIPEGMQIDHKCRNRACCNPDHLEAVTPRENWWRGEAPSRVNAKKTHCQKGHVLSERKGGGRKCVTCEREHAKRQREKNPEWVAVYQAAYREANREKIRAYARGHQRGKRPGVL